MSAPHRTIVLALLMVVALAVSGCSGAPVPTGGASNGATPTRSGDASEAAVVGPYARDPIVIDPSPEGHAKLEAAELADRLRMRERSGMADYLGPDAPALAAALDSQSSELLASIVADAEALATVDLATVQLATVQLASVRLPVDPLGPIPAPPAVPLPGQLASGTLASAVGLLEKSIGGSKAFSKSETKTDEVSMGANKGSIQTDATVAVTPSGSRIVIDVEAKTSGSVSDGTGKLLFRINGVSRAHIEADGCPDSGGVAAAHVDISNSEDYFLAADGGQIGRSWTGHDTGDIKVFVNDQAEVDRVQMDMQGDSAMKGGTRAAGAAQSDLQSYSVGVAETLTMGAGFTKVLGAESHVTASDGATRSNASNAFDGMEAMVSLVAIVASSAARTFWQSGKCIEVVVDPSGGSVDRDSKTSVTAKVRQRFEGAELDKPVEASLSGVKLIEPAGQKVPAPATFTYTAGPKEGDTGEVTFKSVSNRGIGETTVTFTVGGGWIIEHTSSNSTIKGQKCNGLDGDWLMQGVIKGGGLTQTVTFRIVIDGQTLHGTYSYKGITSLPSFTGTIDGTGPASIVVQADGSVLMSLGGTSARSTMTGAGTTATVTLPIPGWTFIWTPGGKCAPA